MANTDYFPSAQNSSRQSLHGRAPSENTAPLRMKQNAKAKALPLSRSCGNDGGSPIFSSSTDNVSSTAGTSVLEPTDLCGGRCCSVPCSAYEVVRRSRSVKESETYSESVESSYDDPNAVTRAWKAQELNHLYDELDDVYVEQAAKDMGFDDQDFSAAGPETSAAQSQLVYEDAYGNDIIKIWAAEEQRRQTVITDHYKLMNLVPRLPHDERGYFVAPVETSAGPGPAVHAPPVHEIVLPPESPDRQQVNDVFDEPASVAAPEVPAVLPFQRHNLWAVNALDSAAVRSTSTFKTQSNLLRTNTNAPKYDALHPRPAPATLPPPTKLPTAPLPPQPQSHVDRLVLRDKIRRERAVQPTSMPSMPQPLNNRPRLRLQTQHEQHEPARTATCDNPSSGEYTSDEDFMPRSARRQIKEQRLLRKAERLKEAVTLTSPPATTERASVAASQGRSPTKSGFQRRGPPKPIRITSAKTGKEVDLARQRAESPTPTRARARRSLSASASESDLESPMTIRATGYMHAARELFLEETHRNVDALGEEH
ncbi:hypothetical protein LTR22_014359 [Elasticomyces elasticus]|nr:hypothetical protein LTR22_014359 [Elasticomyces elasticus]